MIIDDKSAHIGFIRKKEAESHLKMYSEDELFSGDGWLGKPVKTVMGLLPPLADKEDITALDLGCGIGRSCIPIAQFFSDKHCTIDCVDILEYAIEKLSDNAKKYAVENNINGIVSSIDDFRIEPGHYDLIIAVSALEHMDSEESFKRKLFEIRDGLKSGGVVCIIMNSEITETDLFSNEPLIPQFEINLEAEKLRVLLREAFKGFEVLKETVKEQSYKVPRDSIIALLKTKSVTFVAKKG